MRRKNDNAKNKMLHLIAYCNSQISNTTDLMIAANILKMTENNVMLSLEQLANNASVSQASVHRFIRKPDLTAMRISVPVISMQFWK